MYGMVDISLQIMVGKVLLLFHAVFLTDPNIDSHCCSKPEHEHVST